MNDSADQMRTKQIRRELERDANRFATGEDVPPGYSRTEWLVHLKAHEEARRNGTSPPPVRVHDAGGALMFTLIYDNGVWCSEYPPGSTRRQFSRVADDQGFVYFIAAKDGPVKIGTATDPVSRLVTLQCASPYPLSILAQCAGGRRQEKAYHRQFAAHRLNGEWFERHPDILAEIERLTNG